LQIGGERLGRRWIAQADHLRQSTSLLLLLEVDRVFRGLSAFFCEAS
jgi:hypothetical protein